MFLGPEKLVLVFPGGYPGWKAPGEACRLFSIGDLAKNQEKSADFPRFLVKNPKKNKKILVKNLAKNYAKKAKTASARRESEDPRQVDRERIFPSRKTGNYRVSIAKI